MLPKPLQQVDRTYVRVGGQKLSYFAGCDYFRLASHPRVLAAVRRAIRTLGLNVAASRKTTGNHALYGTLEKALANYFDAESALLVSNGYLTNIVVAQALQGEFTHALLDARSHPSLKDAAHFLGCPISEFNHRDAADCRARLRAFGRGTRPIILTDGLFSHDGSVAPLAEYQRLLPRRGWLLVDDAHGAGILGANGRGSVEAEGLDRTRVIQTVTLSKAFGTYGGAILGPRQLRERITETSGAFIGNTPLPLPFAAGALAAVELLKKQPGLRRRLWQNAVRVHQSLQGSAFPLTPDPRPILRFVPGDESARRRMERSLLRERIFPPFIRYPGGPANGFFRIVLSSEHTHAQLDALAEALRRGTLHR